MSGSECCCGTEQQSIQPASARYHVVKNGETLYRISINYATTVEELKKLNRLTSNIIEVGMRLFIPNEPNTPPSSYDNSAPKVQPSVEYQKYTSIFRSIQPLSRIYILPCKNLPVYNLNGIVLENDKPGLIYHSIGVNGAKTSDFNKHPGFFDQLGLLNPDLVVISLGTNESFSHWTSLKYINQLNLMIRNIREKSPTVPILVMSPPPSMLRRDRLNTFIESYAKDLFKTDEYAVWDLFSEMGGLYAPRDKNYALLMAKDKIHYKKEGYRIHGERFSTELLDAYDKYLKMNLK
jgi:lysophospholipase L1-like esterase